MKSHKSYLPFLFALLSLTASLAGASSLLPPASQQKVAENQTRTQHSARSTQHSPLPPSFHRDILPIFRAACVGCHGGANPSSGLVLTSYAGLMKGGRGGAAIVGGK